MKKILFLLLLFCFNPTENLISQILVDENTITYSWIHDFEPMEFSIDFNRGLKFMHKSYATMNHQHGNYPRFVDKDPYKNDLKVFVKSLRRLANQRDISIDKLIVSFVQSLRYNDIDDHQRYPVETLIDGTGDCSDKSVLLVAMLEEVGTDAIFLGYPGHLAVGIEEPLLLLAHYKYSGTYYSYDNEKYFFVETTGNWEIGTKPSSIRDSANISPSSPLRRKIKQRKKREKRWEKQEKARRRYEAIQKGDVSPNCEWC